MPLQKARERGIRVGLGSDVGAGRSLDMRRACSAAFDAGRISGALEGSAALLWRATRGGALALGHGERYGAIEAGFSADLIALRPPKMQAAIEAAEQSGEDELMAAALCDAFVFRDASNIVEEVWINGERRWMRPTSEEHT